MGGRTFSQEILTRIAEAVQVEPEISRRQLSLRVCEWMEWRNPAGRLQEMSCRKSLLELHRRGVIALPAIPRRYAFQKARQRVAPPPLASVECALAELGEVEIVRVTSSAGSALWRGMMDAHHYLKSGPLCGAQLRYLVQSERYGLDRGLELQRLREAGGMPGCLDRLDGGGATAQSHSGGEQQPFLDPAHGEGEVSGLLRVGALPGVPGR